jgi:hypothetical protein
VRRQPPAKATTAPATTHPARLAPRTIECYRNPRGLVRGPYGPLPWYRPIVATKKTTTKKKATKKNPKAAPDTDAVFLALRAIMARHEKKLVVHDNTASSYTVYTKTTAPNGKPLFFGGLGKRKGYVSFYLFPVYTNPELLEGISPELRKRMQGKSCFNFKVIDKPLFAQLAALTKAGYTLYNKAGQI